MIGQGPGISVPYAHVIARDAELQQHVRNWTRLRTDIEDRAAEGQKVIDFAWVKNSHERFAHDHQMSIRGR